MRENLQKQMAAAHMMHASAELMHKIKGAHEAKVVELKPVVSNTRVAASDLKTIALNSLAPFLRNACTMDIHCPIGWTCPVSVGGGNQYCSKACAVETECPISWKCHASTGQCAKFCEKNTDCPDPWECGAGQAGERICRHP